MINPYYIGDNIVHILLEYKGRLMTTLVDIEDFELVNNFPNTWFPKPSKYGFYVIGRYKENENYRFIQMHRLIMKAEEGKEVDHINHDTLDNRKVNLRSVSKSVNQLNRNKSNSQSKTGRRGVHKSESGKYIAQIQINKNKVYLGTHETIEEAENAVNEFIKNI